MWRLSRHRHNPSVSWATVTLKSGLAAPVVQKRMLLRVNIQPLHSRHCTLESGAATRPLAEPGFEETGP